MPEIKPLTDTERLDWIEKRRVVVMRSNIKPECWKVETMFGPYVRDDLRSAIDAAAAFCDQPVEPPAVLRSTTEPQS